MKKGFSLVELLLVLAVISLLATYSINGLDRLIQQNALDRYTASLRSALYFARSYSQSSGYTTSICPSADQLHCDEGVTWSQGWLVFIDKNENRKPDQFEPVKLAKQSHNSNILIRFNAPNTAKTITFYPSGRLWPNSHLSICHAQQSSGKKLVLIQTGRIREQSITDSEC